MTHFTRRHFIAGLAATAAFSPIAQRVVAAQAANEIRARTRVIEVKGKAATVFGLESENGFIFDGQDDVRFNLVNRLEEPTLIHWHGQTPPSPPDGVPMLSQAVLKPGESHAYGFKPRPGTHWMHSHVGFQEQKLLAAPMIFRETTEV